MARAGNPYDNATVESFFKTLKYEEVYLFDYETLADVLQRIPYFIEEVYNRIHPEGLILKEKNASGARLPVTGQF